MVTSPLKLIYIISGLQMHVSVSYYPPIASVSANIKRFCDIGVEVHITEMDVKCANCTTALLAVQAQIYGGMLSACLQNRCCKSFETWGFTDAHTWLGSDTVPLPFDANYVKKPAYYELLATLTAADIPVLDRSGQKNLS